MSLLTHHSPVSDNWLRPAIYYYGGALSIVGIATLALGGFGHFTAAIPLGLGLGLLLIGYGARLRVYSDKFAAIFAANVGVVAFSGTMSAIPKLAYALGGSPAIANAGAVISQGATAFVSLAAVAAFVFIALKQRGQS